MADRLLDEFLDFLKPYLIGSKELTKLIKLRFQETEEKFRNSVDFSRLIHSCRANIQKNKERPFVYIKDFVSELKAYKKKSSKQKKPHKRKLGSDTDTSCNSDVPSKKLLKLACITETVPSKNGTDLTKHQTDVTKAEDVTQSDIVSLSENASDLSDKVGTKEIRLVEFPGDPEVSSTWSPSVSPRSRGKAEEDITPSTSCIKTIPCEHVEDSSDPGVSNPKENSNQFNIDLTLSQVESSEADVCDISTPKPSQDSNSIDTFKSNAESNSNIKENNTATNETCSKPCIVETDIPKNIESDAQSPMPSIDLLKDSVEISEASTSTTKETENTLKSLKDENNSSSNSPQTHDGTADSKEAIPVDKGNNSAVTCKEEKNTVNGSEKGNNSLFTCEDAKTTVNVSEKGSNCASTSDQKPTCSPAIQPTLKLESDLKVSQEKKTKAESSEPLKQICIQQEVLQRLNLVPKRVELLPAKPSTSTVPTCFGQSNSSKGGTNNGAENTPFLSEHKTVVNDKHIRRLEILLAKLRNEIEKVRERELSLDELGEDDSSYLYEDKLQKKFVKVWDKLCELKGRRKTTGRPTEQRFTYEGTRYPEVNKKIESFINKKKIFPDFHDIRNIITKANKRKSLNLSPKLIEMVARDAFTDVGNQLQERRKEDFLTTFWCRLTDINSNSDPALKDPTLKEKLEENRKEGKRKLDQVISKYSEEQITRGEEPEEVGDQSDEEKRETSCSPTNEEEGEELDIPEFIDDVEEGEKNEDDHSVIVETNKLEENIVSVIKEKALNKAQAKTNCKDNKDEFVNERCENDVIENDKKTNYPVDNDEKDDETESENSVVELSTDEQQDEDQSDEVDEQSDVDAETCHLPKTFASVLTRMQIHENLDSPCSSESKSIKGVIDVDDDSNNTASSGGIYMDIAEDSDLPSINESTSTSESSDSDVTEIFKPVLNKIKSPAKSAPTWKLSICTPQKSLIRKALGLKSPSRSPKSLSVIKKRPSVCIKEESTTNISQTNSSKRFKISLNASFTAETTKIVKTMTTTTSSSEVIPIDDPIISSSTGDPDKGGNYVDDDDDIIVLD